MAARRQASRRATCELRRCAHHDEEEEADGDESGRQTLEKSPRSSCLQPSEGTPTVHADKVHIDIGDDMGRVNGAAEAYKLEPALQAR